MQLDRLPRDASSDISGVKKESLTPVTAYNLNLFRFSSVIIFLATYLLIGRIQESIFYLRLLKPTLVILIFLALLAVANDALSTKLINSLLRSKTFKLYAALLCVCAISIPFGIYPSNSLTYFFKMLISINFLYIISTNAFVKKHNDINVLLVAGGLSIITLSVIIYFDPHYIGGRISTSMYDPNDLALCLIIICSLLYPYISSQKLIFKILLLASLCLPGYALYLTKSRAGILTLISVLLTEAATKGAKVFIRRTCILLLVIVTLIAFIDVPDFGRFSTLLNIKDDYNLTHSSGRLAVWKRGLEIIAENPLTGVGLKAFAVAEGSLHQGGKWSVAHNSFIEIGADLGLPGLVLFISMLLSAFRCAKPVSEEDWLGRGLRLALVAYAIGGFFLSWAYNFILYYLLTIAVIRERLIVEDSNFDKSTLKINRAPIVTIRTDNK
jgi:O-antigen ligase